MNKAVKKVFTTIMTLAVMLSALGLMACSKKAPDITELQSGEGALLEFIVAPMAGDSKTSYTVNKNGNIIVSAPDIINGGEYHSCTKMSDDDYLAVVDFLEKFMTDNDFGEYTTDGGDFYYKIKGFDNDGKEYVIFDGYQTSIKEINDLNMLLGGYQLEAGGIIPED